MFQIKFLVEVLNNTLWLSSGAVIHVSTILQGFIMIQTTNPNKKILIHERSHEG